MKTTWVDVWGQGVLVGGLTAENVRKPQGTGLLHGALSQGEGNLVSFKFLGVEVSRVSRSCDGIMAVRPVTTCPKRQRPD